MAITVLIPSNLQHLTGGERRVRIEGATVAEAIAALERQHVGVKSKLVNGDDQLRSFISLFVNQKDVRTLEGLKSPLKDGDELAIIPAMAGG